MKNQKNKILPILIHGIDAVDLTRGEFKNTKLPIKIFHVEEFKYYLSLSIEKQIKYIAVIWAIKEAIYKALNASITYPSIHVSKQHDGYQFLHPFYDVVISVSYMNNYLLASVIGIKKTPN